MMSMCKCNGLVYHLRSQILTLQHQSQQTHTLCDGGWEADSKAFQQEHLEDQTQKCKRYWLEVPDLCGSVCHLT